MVHSVPLELPLKTSEASRIAGLIFQQAEGRRLNADLRNRLSARMQGLQLSSVVPLTGSLQRDPIHPSTYYLAADTCGAHPQHLLLRIASASSPSSGLFPQAVLIGRMRTDEGPEVVVNAIRFDHSDRENIRTFAERVDPEFLPRPQGSAPTICVQHEAFEAYRSILRSTGANVAAVFVEDDIAVDRAVWSAIRSGWREGYTIETEVASSENIPQGCTKFTVMLWRTLSACRVPSGPGTHADACLEHLVNIHDAIRTSSKRKFDFEVSFADAPSITTPEDLSTCLQFLKSQGKPAQSVIPRYETIEQLAALSGTARQFGAILTVRSNGLLPLDVLEQIGKATAGRVNYKICNPGTSCAEISRMILLAAERLRS